MTSTSKTAAWKKGCSALAICAAAAANLSAARAAGAAPNWPMGGNDIVNSRNQNFTPINPANVSSLTLAWTFTTGGDVTATPAVAFNPALGTNVVYFPDFKGNFYAVNGQTGQKIWSNTVGAWTGAAGDYARDDPAVYQVPGGPLEVILGNQAGYFATISGGSLQGAGAWIVAVDANTGGLLWKTQVYSFPAGYVTGSPVIYKGVVYVGVGSAEEFTATKPGYPCCTSRGSVVALDAATGAIKWQTYMVPDNHGLMGGYSGGSVWDSTPAVDVARNSLYVGTGNNFSVPSSVSACFAASPLKATCTDPTDYFDSIVALDLTTGAVKWAGRSMNYDAWNVSCLVDPGIGNCPAPSGPDYDFGGAGPNLITVPGTGQQLVGVGAKSGRYWALNPDTGAVVWSRQVGPGSTLGGLEWGTAFDGTSVYVAESNSSNAPYSLQPSGAKVIGGSWGALNPATGALTWQTATPGACFTGGGGSVKNPVGYAPGCMALGPVSSANGVVFGGSMDTVATDPTMFALNGVTGKILWKFAAGSSVIAGPAIAGPWVYWGSGYSRFGPALGTGNNKLFAFILAPP